MDLSFIGKNIYFIGKCIKYFWNFLLNHGKQKKINKKCNELMSDLESELIKISFDENGRKFENYSHKNRTDVEEFYTKIEKLDAKFSNCTDKELKIWFEKWRNAIPSTDGRRTYNRTSGDTPFRHAFYEKFEPIYREMNTRRSKK